MVITYCCIKTYVNTQRFKVPADSYFSLSLWGQPSGKLSGGLREGAAGDSTTGRLDRGQSTALRSSSFKQRAGACWWLAGGLGSGPPGLRTGCWSILSTGRWLSQSKRRGSGSVVTVPRPKSHTGTSATFCSLETSRRAWSTLKGRDR